MKKIVVLLVVFMLSVSFVLNTYASEDAAVEASAAVPVQVQCKAYVLMDCNTGTVLANQNENERYYPASVTKIMTLLLIMEAIQEGKLTLDMEITCSESAAEKGGSQIWLEAGELMTVDELLKATVVYSANDACCLLAEYIGGDEHTFVELMNKKAEMLGMQNTYFENCTGLDDDTDLHKTSAYDIAVMSRELLKYDLIRNYTSIWMDSLRSGETQLVNTNKLMRTYPGATGLKTGTTSKAGCCISASAQRDGLELIAVVLGADNSKLRFSAAKELLDWGFANYEILKLDASDKYDDCINVTHGVKRLLKITHSEATEVLIEKGSAENITVKVILPEELEAPVEKDAQIGYVEFYCNDKEIGKIALIADEKIERMTLSNAIMSLFYALSNKNL